MKAAQPVFSLAVSCAMLAAGLAAAAPPARSPVNDPGTVHEAVDVNVVNVEVYVSRAVTVSATAPAATEARN